jgi:hypothetical protein
MEMAHFNEHPKGQGLVTNLINRLKILIMEELSFHETVISSYLIMILDMYDKDRSDYRLLYSFCDIVFEAKRNRCVTYQNSWWRYEEFELEDIPLDHVLTYKTTRDSDEFLQIGEHLIQFVKAKDERMFGCFMKLGKMGDQGLRWRRKDAAYIWFQVLEPYMDTGDLKCIFQFALKQFQKKAMTERYAFAVWIGLLVWKRDTLTHSDEGIPYALSSSSEAERYMMEMTTLPMDGYVVNDYHVNKSWGLGSFAENGAFVKDEYMDLLDDGTNKKYFYIKEQKIKSSSKKPSKVKATKIKTKTTSSKGYCM